MGIYGNKFIEREVTLEDAIIEFESECNQYSKIFESVNILNESGIILEFSFKDIIEKIKDFFRMIGRKIKELWDKIFHRKENIDEKKEEAEKIFEAVKEAAKDMPEEKEDEDNNDSSNDKETHHIKGIRFFKEVSFKKSGKPVKTKIRIKLSKNEFKEKKFKYDLLDMDLYLNRYFSFPIGSFTYLSDILDWCEDYAESNKVDVLEEKIKKYVETHKEEKKSKLSKLIEIYDTSKFNRIDLKTEEGTFDEAGEKIKAQSDEITKAIDNCKSIIKKLEDKIAKLENKNYDIPEAVMNDKRILMWINTAASEDIKNIKNLIVASNKYLSALLGIYGLSINNLEKLNAQAAIINKE